MSPSSPPDVNYWYDKRCARAFWSQGEIGPYHQLQAHTAAWIAPGAGEDWLDLGCGMGRLTKLIWEKSAGQVGSIVALDCAAANADALAHFRLANGIAPERVRFLHADFSPGLGSFPSHSFHGVVSGLAIQYAQHWSAEKNAWTTEAYEHLLREIHRVLKPGGTFVFSVNVPEPSWLRVGLYSFPDFFRAHKPLRFLRNCLRMGRYGTWLKREARRGRFHYLPSGDIHAKLAAAGFLDVVHRLSFARQAYVFRGRKPA